MLEIRFDRQTVPVGGEVCGEVVWTAEKDCTPRKITVSLGWRTEGRGDTDRATLATADQDGGPTFAGDVLRIPFRGQIPADSTPSFAGHLIRLVWLVAVRVDLPWAFDEKLEDEISVVSASGLAEP